MLKGKVVWFDDVKGYGFIKPEGEEDSKDVFVHYSGIEGEGFKKLEKDQVVEFKVKEDDKGLRAEGVVVVEEGQ